MTPAARTAVTPKTAAAIAAARMPALMRFITRFPSSRRPPLGQLSPTSRLEEPAGGRDRRDDRHQHPVDDRVENRDGEVAQEALVVTLVEEDARHELGETHRRDGHTPDVGNR